MGHSFALAGPWAALDAKPSSSVKTIWVGVLDTVLNQLQDLLLFVAPYSVLENGVDAHIPLLLQQI